MCRKSYRYGGRVGRAEPHSWLSGDVGGAAAETTDGPQPVVQEELLDFDDQRPAGHFQGLEVQDG
jgi:hypothetical protein